MGSNVDIQPNADVNQKNVYDPGVNPPGILPNGFVLFLALLLCGVSFLIMFLDHMACLGEGSSFSQQSGFLLRFGGVSILYGLAGAIVLMNTQKLGSSFLSLVAGIALLAFSLLLRVPGFGYPLDTPSRIYLGGMAIPGLDLVILGYILLMAGFLRYCKNEKGRIAFICLVTVAMVPYLWYAKSYLMIIVICAMAFLSIWGNRKRQILMVTGLAGVAGFAAVLYGIRSYDTFILLEGKDVSRFSPYMLRIAAWVLPSARMKTALGTAADEITRRAQILGGGSALIRNVIPDLRFTNNELTMLYITSWAGNLALFFLIILYGVLTYQVYLRYRKNMALGDTTRAVICLGLFLQFLAAGIFHFGYAFQILPLFHYYMPFLTFTGQYFFLLLLELGLVLRTDGGEGVRKQKAARKKAQEEQALRENMAKALEQELAPETAGKDGDY